jgi:hypothetical protein
MKAIAYVILMFFVVQTAQSQIPFFPPVPQQQMALATVTVCGIPIAAVLIDYQSRKIIEIITPEGSLTDYFQMAFQDRYWCYINDCSKLAEEMTINLNAVGATFPESIERFRGLNPLSILGTCV